VRTAYETIIQEEKPLLIDPCNDTPSSHFSFKEDGFVDFLTERGKVTIELLQLNRKQLIADRNSTLANLGKVWTQFVSYMVDQEKNWPALQEIGKEWALILDEQSSKPYIAASKQFINNKIKDHPDILSFFEKKLYEFKLETRILTYDTPPQIKIIDQDSFKETALSVADRLRIEQIPLLLTKQLYLESIEVQNYKCFDYLKLELKAWTSDLSDAGQRPWLLFLGENGVGKSSILKAIAIALMGTTNQNKWAEYLNPNSLLKRGKSKGFIKLSYNDGEETLVSFTKDSSELISTLKTPISNLIGYGSIRLLPKKQIKPEQGSFDGVKVGNLFDYTIALEDATNWLLKTSKKDFDKAAITLKDLMLLSPETKLTKDKKQQQILVKFEGKEPMPVDHLSDGYRTIYALAVDIISTLSTENITYDLAEGIILIDEIETHLHPRWKMQVVERLRYAFPKLNFIVSTHEPLCLRGMHKDETIVLTLGENNDVVALADLPDPSELRIDQILTSEFFGLKSTMDTKTEKLFEEYYTILAKDQNDRTQDEIDRSFELNTLIPKIKHLGNDLRSDLAYYIIDELLAQKVKNEGLKIDELKEKAISRVRSIWKTIKSESNDLS
jgi:energy-coupling factor transporter ATP-binding protein EcfA2